MAKKLLLIDGHSMLNRAFYGVPDFTDGKGRHTGAVYGFFNILFSVLDEESPDALAVAFDVHAPTFRHEKYEAYKGTRKPMPEELKEQVPLTQEVLAAMHVPCIMQAGLEADDVIGTLAKRAQTDGYDVVVLSGDRDLLQLADTAIRIRIPKTSKGKTEVFNYTPADVKEAYGVTPSEFIDVKALMGDTSDNIPGVPSIGEKTATKIIQDYGSIENAYAHADEIKPPRAAANLKEHYDLAVLSKDLATIRTDCDLPFAVADAGIRGLFTPEARALFQEMGIKTFLSRFDAAGAPASAAPAFAFRTVANAAEAEAFLKALPAGTLGLHLLEEDGVLYGAAVSTPDETVFLAADTRSSEPQQLSLFEEAPAPETPGALTPDRLKNALAAAVLHAAEVWCFSVKDTLHLLAPVWEKTGALPAGDDPLPVCLQDAHLAAYLLNPLKSEYTYGEIAQLYAGVTLPDRESIGPKGSLSAWKADQRAELASAAAFSARVSGAPLLKALAENGMDALYRDIDRPLIWPLYVMERNGIRVKKEELADYGDSLTAGIESLEKEIYALAGEEFNILSPKQLGEVLFDRLHLPSGKKTSRGYSTSADVLDKLAPDWPIVKKVLDYRGLTKLKSTYAVGLSAFIAPDGRIHGKFHQTVTATGRLSSADPNLQNIPVRTELGRALRKVFVPADGWVFIDADYSQIELRILAHMSGDDNLIAAYNQAEDIHAITASQVFHVPLEEVTPQLRRNAKAVNFGIVYGISAFGLSEDLSISRKEATDYIARYFAAYPGVKSFLDRLVANAKEKGYAETLYGRRRPMPELKSSNFMQRSFGERVAMNAPIQGTAADIIKIAMISVERRLRAEGLKARLVLQVHDELLIEAPPEEEAAVRRILKEEMSGAAALRVALEIGMESGKSWYECK